MASADTTGELSREASRAADKSEGQYEQLKAIPRDLEKMREDLVAQIDEETERLVSEAKAAEAIEAIPDNATDDEVKDALVTAAFEGIGYLGDFVWYASRPAEGQVLPKAEKQHVYAITALISILQQNTIYSPYYEDRLETFDPADVPKFRQFVSDKLVPFFRDNKYLAREVLESEREGLHNAQHMLQQFQGDEDIYAKEQDRYVEEVVKPFVEDNEAFLHEAAEHYAALDGKPPKK